MIKNLHKRADVRLRSCQSGKLARRVVFCVAVIALILVLVKRQWFQHQIIYNANVLTMNSENGIAEAVVVDKGVITYVGSSVVAREQKRWYSTETDLLGQSLLPGFIDSHSHFLSVGIGAVAVDLNPPPAGDVSTLEQLYQRVRDRVRKVPDGEWILGFNYDNTALPGGEHPDKRALDAISTDHPIFVRHNSGHMGVANSRALEVLGVHSQVFSEGAFVGMYPDSKEPNGLLQESAAPRLDQILDEVSWMDYWRIFTLATDTYASQGFTTVQDGGVSKSAFDVLGWLSRLKLLPLRIVVWLSHEKMGSELMSGAAIIDRYSSDLFSVAAVKLVLDGSPQGYTAYLSQPYFVPPVGQPAYRGHARFSKLELARLLVAYQSRGFTLAVHANGDGAIDELLSVLDSMVVQVKSLRQIILVHAQTIRNDQLSRLRQYGVTPSFFPTHTFYWGDWHRTQSLGAERAGMISPLHSAGALGLRYSIHTDAPVTPLGSMQLLWSATERKTASDVLLGQEERVDRQSALRAMTIDAAWQASVDDTRGSIEVGKFADFVVLSNDPVTVPDVREIAVLRTIVAGRSVYVSTR